MSATPRAALVQELHDRLDREGFPRLTVALIVSLAGAAAFLASFLLLAAGVDSMGLRYAAAAAAGYLAFILLIGGWVALRRGWHADDATPLDVLDASLDLTTRGGRSASSRTFAGGRSGGAGSGGDWDPVEAVHPGSRPFAGGTGAADGLAGGIDLDELWWVAAAAALALAALVAIGFVVYSAPLLLAEVALDAAIFAPVYRRLRREEAGSWAGAVLRKTGVPALVVVVFVSGAGFALQAAVPEARSIGGVVRLLGR